ncbi:MAG: NifB/NifX family molybdenum-iron cluster-binding protein [Candidatus Bipolaricaulota bacterium]
MKVIVTAAGTDKVSNVDPRFGRCPYFVIWKSDSDQLQVIDNSSSNAASGAGVQAAQTVIERGADAVITGNVGPNAFRALDSASIPVYTGAEGTVEQALSDWQEEKLQKAERPTSQGGRGKPGK